MIDRRANGSLPMIPRARTAIQEWEVPFIADRAVIDFDVAAAGKGEVCCNFFRQAPAFQCVVDEPIVIRMHLVGNTDMCGKPERQKRDPPGGQSARPQRVQACWRFLRPEKGKDKELAWETPFTVASAKGQILLAGQRWMGFTL